jgi:hypothetical protein
VLRSSVWGRWWCVLAGWGCLALLSGCGQLILPEYARPQAAPTGLPNGDIEADFGGVSTGSVIDEWNGTGSTRRLAWQAVTPGTFQFCTDRLPSLYPACSGRDAGCAQVQHVHLLKSWPFHAQENRFRFPKLRL